MTEQQARRAGLTFTGAYKRYHEKDELKEEAKKIRKLGYRAVLVSEESGYSVYAQEEYMEKIDVIERKRRLINEQSSILNQIKNLKLNLQKNKEKLEDLKDVDETQNLRV